MQQRQLIEVDPQRIKFNPNNPRKHRGTEYIRLKESIKRIGIVQLPTVRVLPGGFYEVIDGEGRVSVAQEEKFEKIWAVSVGVIDEQEALVMLQSANVMRSFNLLAECKGLANLYGQGATIRDLAKQFSNNEKRISTMVAVGYFPSGVLRRIEESVAEHEERAEVWNYTILENVLPLRELLPGKTASGGGHWFPLDDLYDYSEVDKAIEQVIQGKITNGEQMHTYVVNRKYKIYEDRFNQELHRRVEEELASTRQDLERAKERQVQEAEQQTQLRYAEQVDLLERQLKDLEKRLSANVNEAAKRPETIAKREKELDEELQKARKSRQELADRQRQWEEEIYRERIKLQQVARETQEQLRQEIKQTLDTEVARQLEEQKLALKRQETALAEYYAKKDRERQLKAENTVQGLLSHGVKTLAEAQQVIEHIISGGMIQGVRQLGGAQQDSLLWMIRSLCETLEKAETKLTQSDVVMQVESEATNGYK